MVGLPGSAGLPQMAAYVASRPLPRTRRLQTFRLLHACSGCFRLERIAGWGLHPLESAALSRRTPTAFIPVPALGYPCRVKKDPRSVAAGSMPDRNLNRDSQLRGHCEWLEEPDSNDVATASLAMFGLTARRPFTASQK